MLKQKTFNCPCGCCVSQSWKILFHNCLPHFSLQQVDITSCPHNVSLVKTRRDIFKGTNWFHPLPFQNPVWSVSVTTADNAEMPLAGWRDGFGGRLVIGDNWGWQTDISRSTLAVPESTEANKVKTGLQRGENSSDTETVWGKFDFQNQMFQKPPKTGAGCLHGNNTNCSWLRPGTPPSKLCLVASSREELTHKATKKGRPTLITLTWGAETIFPSGMIAVCAVAKATKLYRVFSQISTKDCTEQREFTHSSCLPGTIWTRTERNWLWIGHQPSFSQEISRPVAAEKRQRKLKMNPESLVSLLQLSDAHLFLMKHSRAEVALLSKMQHTIYFFNLAAL